MNLAALIDGLDDQKAMNSRAFLIALSGRNGHTYGGTVPAAEVAKRRAKNRVARASRRVNRKH